MEKQQMKLGARILSAEEMNAILPNAESVYELITVFRNSISDEGNKQSKEHGETEQKTNNIGIMGCRGAGKTSILKTFYHQLKGDVNDTRNEENEKYKSDGDIILPIIIPENMSSGTTLMDTVLGRLKSVVEEKEARKERDNYSGDCIYSGRASLEQQYNELVKQYCYIKKDYRDILIQQFTTEQNYVDKTKKVFSSDSEFIDLFNKFVIELLQTGKKADKKEPEENPMIFLFIDDVDLCTNRCMDIVRTLLVYLSNPRIVTFISGDIRTFEEELTLEFLRQEGALREDVFRKTFFTVNEDSGRNSLLERKKLLAYEYLKKIIPPAYRRTIRYWSLEDRGNYQIAGTDGSKQKNLAELLVEVSKEKLRKLYFLYKEDEKQECMGLAFHMFDDTSRGLNNIYNVLQEISDTRANDKDITAEREKLLFWRLIETMVDSKPLYAKYKTELLQHIIVLGQNQVKVDFKNAHELLYGETEEKEKKEERNKEASANEAKKSMNGFSAKDRFAIYFLIDFAARLFSQEPHEDDYGLQNRIIQEYLSDETIDDKIAPKRELIGCLVGRQEVASSDDFMRQILINFLRKCDFVLVLHLIGYLGRAEIYDILSNRKKSEREIAYKTAYALSRAIQAVNESEEDIKNYLTDLYMQMRDAMLGLLSMLSLNPWIIYGMQLTDDVNIGIGINYIKNEEANLAEASFGNIEKYMKEENLLQVEYQNRNLVYWIYYERVLRERQQLREIVFNIKEGVEEAVSAGITKTIMNQMLEWKTVDRYEVRALNEISYGDLLEGKDKEEKNEIQVIKLIDKQRLWDSSYARDIVKGYLKRKRVDYVFDMSCGRAIFDATQFVTGAFAELENCYKGSSGKALVYYLQNKLMNVMFLPLNGDWHGQGIFSGGKYYLRLEQALIIQCLLEEFLYLHQRAKYGKKESRRLLMEAKELPLVIPASDRNVIDAQLQERERQFFASNSNYIKSRETIEFETSETGKSTLENIRATWYDSSTPKHAPLKNLIKEHLGRIGENDYMYFLYLIQKNQIERMKAMMQERTNENRKEEISWSSIEPDIPERDYIFFFHSYLRYRQVNDSDAKKAGTRAEDIAKLARYMLDSEIKADERLQNEVYQVISKELDLTEEEFESLFQRR